MKFRSILCLFLMLAALAPQAALAQVTDPKTTPVAVISLVWGVVTIKHANADYQAARWLEPIFPGDQVKTTGPGSKLLITYFFDNHQEVLPLDSEASAGATTLTTMAGGTIRKDKARNPFGNGVQNPFVYTHKLVTVDFKGTDDPTLMEKENTWLKAKVVNSGRPLTFGWPAVSGAKNYQYLVNDATGKTVVTIKSPKSDLTLTAKQAEPLFLGTVYTWFVTAKGANVIAPYQFFYLNRPLSTWLAETRKTFTSLRTRKQLQRSDYTDYLLISAQLLRIDDALNLALEMASMDGKNPQVFRALTRAYLAKGCAAHARQAHDKEIQLGGYDPIYP